MSRSIDDLIGETLRSIYGNPRIQGSTADRGGGGLNRSGAGHGRPGYPVPKIPEGSAAPKSPVPDDPTKDPNKGFSEWNDELVEGMWSANEEPIAYDCRQIQYEFENLLVKNGMQVSSELGSGTMGVAFLLTNGQVLKITSDEREAKAARVVAGRNLNNVYRVFKVFRFPKSTDDNLATAPFYGIVQEKLEPLSEQEKKTLSLAVKDACLLSKERDIEDLFHGKDWLEIGGLVELYDDEGAKGKNLGLSGAETLKLLEKFNLDKIFDQLYSVKVRWSDLTTENIMKRGDEYVVIDLGYSDSAGRAETIPVIESKGPEPERFSKKQAKTQSISDPITDTSLDIDHTFRTLFANDQLLKKRGIVIDEYTPIGRGTRGHVFEIQDRSLVFKVTNDAAEALAAFKIVGKKLKKIYHVTDVFRFPVIEGRRMLYGIVQERLLPLSPDQARSVDEAFEFFDITHEASRARGSWTTLLSLFNERMQDLYKIYNDFARENLQRDAATYSQVLKKIGLEDMFRELRASGIVYHDFHSGNIMKRPDGSLVLVDLGFSHVDNPRQPPILEKVVDAAGQASYDECYEAIDDDFELLEARGIIPKEEEPLGAGSHGVVFELEDGRILKVTDDETEAKASMTIKGKPTKRLLRVFDVFRFKTHRDYFGIVQERLTRLSKRDARYFDLLSDTLARNKCGNEIATWDYDGIVAKLRANEDADVAQSVVDIMEEFEFKEILAELASFKIEYLDFHSGNIMMRGSTHVVVDLGVSKSPGVEPPTLESLMADVVVGMLSEGPGYVSVAPIGHGEEERTLKAGKMTEGKLDTVAVTMGQFQPFHRGYSELLRNLSRSHTKVIVFLREGPVSRETMLELMESSLVDVWKDLEVLDAKVNGSETADFSALLSRAIDQGESTLDAETSVTVLVPKQDVERAKVELTTKHDGESYDGNIAIVKSLPEVSVRIDAREAAAVFASGDPEKIRPLVDPHLASNATVFTSIVEKLSSELKKEKGQIESVIENVLNEIGLTMTPGSGPGSHQAGVRAGSSGWSSPQGIAKEDEVEEIRDGEFRPEVWSDHLRGVKRAPGIGERDV